MATELYANVATTTVSSGGATAPSGGSSESWTVASSTPFPAAATGVSQFHVADPAQPSELVTVTNVSGTTWTVTRGAESTTPVTHAAGFTIWLVVTAADLTALATLASPALSGVPTAPTASALTSNTQLATTAYADSATGVEKSRAMAAEALLAPLASAALTGTPTAPTKTALTNNTDIATTAYADAAVAVEVSRAEAAEALALPLTGGTMSGAIAMGSHKVTGLTNGSSAQDGAAFGQIPVVEGTVGNIKAVGTAAALGTSGKWPDSDHVHAGVQLAGDLGNTIASPQVVSTHLSAALPVAQGGTGATTLAATSGAGILSLVATTPAAGVALINGTQTFLTWTAPNDGNAHMIAVSASLHVTSGETGGAIALNTTLPDGTANNAAAFIAAGQSISVQSNFSMRVVQAASTVTLTQGTALTAGAAVIFAQMYAA